MAVQNADTCRATRAVDVVHAGEALRNDAAALTEDVNAAYYLVHQAVSRALAEPGCAEVSAKNLSRGMNERFVEGPDDAPDTARTWA